MEWFGIGALVAPPTDGHVLHGFRHAPALLTLALILAIAAAYNVFGMLDRARHAVNTRASWVWNALGLLSLASSVWAMHLVALFTLHTPFPISYALVATNLSALPALVSAGLVIWLLNDPRYSTRGRHLPAALLFACGALATMLGGLTAIRSTERLTLDASWMAIGLPLAAMAAYAAFLLAVPAMRGQALSPQKRMAGSVLLGAAIMLTHYCASLGLAMSVPKEAEPIWDLPSNRIQLCLAVSVVYILLTATMILAERVDRTLQQRESDLRRIRRQLARLDHTDDTLRLAAHQDPLTGLLNRRGFEDAFSERLAEHQINQRSFAVMFLDIDHFKRINDSMGHDAGDELLKVISQRIRGELRDGDVVARFGGDEFCVLVPVDHADEANTLAQRVMEKMKAPISLAGRSLVMTTSIGISLFPEHGDSLSALLKHADMALYHSKGIGRDNIHLFDDALRLRAQHETRLDAELRRALETDVGLDLHYMPVLPIAGGEPVQLEALLRWRHPRYGLIPADKFISIAEANGFIGELDRWAMNRACQDIAELTANGHTRIPVAINCSAHNFADEEMPRALEVALRRSGISPFRLNVEITEDALTANIQRAVRLLRKIYRLGVSISIDNFGTGYSSLPYLKRLPLDMVKIDRAFTQELTIANESREIVHAIIAMAHAMQLRVVAEGIEREDQLALLDELGCDLGQGHLFAAPMAMPALLDYLAQWQPDYPIEAKRSCV